MGKSAFYVACQTGNIELVTYLLNCGKIDITEVSFGTYFYSFSYFNFVAFSVVSFIISVRVEILN